MDFYVIRPKEYATDLEYRHANPLEAIGDVCVPGIACEACGRTWALHGARLASSVPANFKESKLLKPSVLPSFRHRTLMAALRTSMGLNEDFVLPPGTTLGTLRVKVKSPLQQHIMWDEQYGPFVSPHVMQVLESAGLKGCSFAQCQILPKKGLGLPEVRLYELVVTGTEKLPLPYSQPLEACSVCGYAKLESFVSVDINVKGWSGNDLFKLGHSPLVFVTERVKAMLEEHGLSANAVFDRVGAIC